MAYIIDSPKKRTEPTHHIRFHPDDEARLVAKAKQAGMSVNAYIKSRALNSRAPRKRVSSFPNVAHIITHIEAMDRLAQEIRIMIKKPHTDRLLYEADLERIDQKLTELLRTENTLVDACMKRR